MGNSPPPVKSLPGYGGGFAGGILFAVSNLWLNSGRADGGPSSSLAYPPTRTRVFPGSAIMNWSTSETSDVDGRRKVGSEPLASCRGGVTRRHPRAGKLAGLLYPTGELSFVELVGFSRSLVSSESGRGER